MNAKHLTTFCLLIVVVLSTALLIGNRFDASWAGGDGYEQHGVAHVGEETYERGEIIESGEGEYVQVDLFDATVLMDENTQVKLVYLMEGDIEINVVQGRIVAEGELIIATRDVATVVNGSASYVHYSWLGEVEIAPIDGSVYVAYQDTAHILSGDALRLSTLSPYENEAVEFDPTTSSASAFYEWVTTQSSANTEE